MVLGDPKSFNPQRVVTHRLGTNALEPCHIVLAHELPGVFL